MKNFCFKKFQSPGICEQPWKPRRICSFAFMMSASPPRLYQAFTFLLLSRFAIGWPALVDQHFTLPPWAADHGHNELYKPNATHIFPMKMPFTYDETQYYYELHQNNDRNGTYKRASCPALNTLANRGFIPRTGRGVTYQNLAQSMRDVFNFGDDNVQCRHFFLTYYQLTSFADYAGIGAGIFASSRRCYS